MSFAVIFLILAVGFLGIIALPKLFSNKQTIEPDPQPVRGDELAIWPFAPMPIMTATEVIFFNKLKNALPEYHIFVQVQLSRIIEANSDETSERSFWFNRICRQSVDYVIVDVDARTTLVAIELDDWTHSSKARQKADDKKDKALASAGIAIVRFHAERMPSADMLRYELMQVIESY
ncbi:hypothetical protein Psyc_0437 [Psychrobacter arcticus 273-4]|uniref:DUF2726 domain-containing protein n=1 Tax=Psychrobacter arcticus (strain DSM 17307 / VKM B-2377 / 273-4) TaxID=259536 RepID=Q4FUK8_PSYA2|nr:DUF2726 domain-containing protein [Psychrobacter arcticus]AAZ18300.1 hypothetical protein Psyc_0437 [Psychrobacter arcticus 273-4]